MVQKYKIKIKTYKYKFTIKSFKYEFTGSSRTLGYIKKLFFYRLERCGESICYVSKRNRDGSYTRPKMYWFKLS